eukprot:4697302-Alexandrium_andersonii.AAC.1
MEDARGLSESALNLSPDTGRQSTAIAKAILIFAEKFNASESQLAQISGVVQSIMTGQAGHQELPTASS